MRVRTVGDGTPELAVVACLHGDEPCGETAIERMLAETPAFERPVRFVVANEEAIAANARYVDEDLNRAFPGDPNGATHESRLAAALLSELRDCAVLDFHSTRSHPDPFALVSRLNDRTKRLVRATDVGRVVDISYVAGGLVDHVDGVAVECGLRGTERAARNAERVLRNALGSMGALDALSEEGTPELYRVFDAVMGRDYEFVGENFVRVEEGAVFARTVGEELRADRPFYPVLMSTDGYDEMVGFRAERVGKL
ncbi:succinylglutamate desuccinylase/aspartoacylase domain-containing protein [Haladaptatus halobius]|uniref:succinylglutamate desuccinylase/aspartoacylase domain-containing protein n=1 Tax=Haladaptatus halobius TaxID=2884875 RepID=UPI001D0BDCC8|nr:succinylglutamate desuccinylase/aspartoacylase family protein [Haladaptatus halobius]